MKDKYRHKYEGLFKKALVTPTHTFYINNSDGLHVYDNEGNLMAESGFIADEYLFKAVEDNNYTWASKDMLYNIKCIREERNQ